MHFMRGQTGTFLEFFHGGRAAHFMFDLPHGFVQSAHTLAQAAREPVQTPQFIQHRSAYAVFRIGFKADTQLGLEFSESFQQAKGARADQLGQFDVAGQFCFQAQSEKADFRSVMPGDIFFVRKRKITPAQCSGFQFFPCFQQAVSLGRRRTGAGIVVYIHAELRSGRVISSRKT